MYCEIFAQLKI